MFPEVVTLGFSVLSGTKEALQCWESCSPILANLRARCAESKAGLQCLVWRRPRAAVAQQLKLSFSCVFAGDLVWQSNDHLPALLRWLAPLSCSSSLFPSLLGVCPPQLPLRAGPVSVPPHWGSVVLGKRRCQSCLQGRVCVKVRKVCACSRMKHAASADVCLLFPQRRAKPFR